MERVVRPASSFVLDCGSFWAMMKADRACCCALRLLGGTTGASSVFLKLLPREIAPRERLVPKVSSSFGCASFLYGSILSFHHPFSGYDSFHRDAFLPFLKMSDQFTNLALQRQSDTGWYWCKITKKCRPETPHTPAPDCKSICHTIDTDIQIKTA